MNQSENEGALKECCQNPNNLEKVESTKPDLSLYACQVCGCRHFKLKIESGKIGATFKQ